MSKQELGFSVVIPTRNRPTDAETCARSVLAIPGQFEVAVVDQSENDQTTTALARIGDPRLVVLRSTERGASRARNLGASKTSGEILAFTDDDCQVPANWLAKLGELFNADPRVAMVLGAVKLCGEKPDGWGAAFDPAEQLVSRDWPAGDDGWGLGANLAVRRSAFESLNGFDPMLGAGSELAGGEDTDLQMRALTSGARLLYTPASKVDHYGVRYGEEVRRLILAYSASFGATLGKQVLLGAPGARRYLASILVRKTALAAGRAIRSQRPLGIGQIRAVVQGARRVWREYSVDCQTGLLKKR